jgi:hypothetical protein
VVDRVDVCLRDQEVPPQPKISAGKIIGIFFSQRTVHIDTRTTPTTKFDLTYAEKKALFDAGYVRQTIFSKKDPGQFSTVGGFETC